MAHRLEDIGISADYPLFTPAASSMYVRSTPADSNLNWFNPDNQRLCHPAALYSAGHAHLGLTQSRAMEGMITGRDRNRTILIADSGGYQIGTGAFQKSEPFRTDIHGLKANLIRKEILTWSEAFADYAMTLDYPAWALGRANYLMRDFNHCLDETYYNCAFIERERRQNQVKLLNVIQGRDYPEARKWYNEVKVFDFEGWSLAGPVAANPEITMKIILHLWKDGNISRTRNWIHILGRSSNAAVWVNNVFHRCIRRHICQNAQISYDSSSVVHYALYGWKLVGSRINADEMTLDMEKQQRKQRDANDYTSDICDNLDSMLGTISTINELSARPVGELRESGSVPDFFISFKEDVEGMFQHIADVGIDHYNIDDVRLREYRNLIK